MKNIRGKAPADHDLVSLLIQYGCTVVHAIWDRAWLLLTYTAAIWGGNAVAARFAVDQISPMSLVLLRWLFVSLILTWLVRRRLPGEGRALFEHKRLLMFLGLTGFTAFSALFYVAAYQTTAMNITILQSSMPPLVLLGSLLLYHEPVTAKQIAGMMMAIVLVAQGRFND